jgi:hypothetical protein
MDYSTQKTPRTTGFGDYTYLNKVIPIHWSNKRDVYFVYVRMLPLWCWFLLLSCSSGDASDVLDWKDVSHGETGAGRPGENIVIYCGLTVRTWEHLIAPSWRRKVPGNTSVWSYGLYRITERSNGHHSITVRVNMASPTVSQISKYKILREQEQSIAHHLYFI